MRGNWRDVVNIVPAQDAKALESLQVSERYGY